MEEVGWDAHHHKLLNASHSKSSGIDSAVT